MKILSVHVGLPREVTWQGKLVTTGIFKEPVKGPVMLRTLNLDGDQQADLTVHGGVSKAVYVYPSEHYGYWRAELPGVDLPWGMCGYCECPKFNVIASLCRGASVQNPATERRGYNANRRLLSSALRRPTSNSEDE